MINIDTHFFLEARHVDFMTTIKERSWFANMTNHDDFQTVSNLLCVWPVYFIYHHYVDCYKKPIHQRGETYQFWQV